MTIYEQVIILSKHNKQVDDNLVSEREQYEKRYKLYRSAAIVLSVIAIMYLAILGWNAYFPTFPLLVIAVITSGFFASNYQSMIDLIEANEVMSNNSAESKEQIILEDTMQLENASGTQVLIPFPEIKKVVLTNYAKPMPQYYQTGAAIIFHYANGVYIHQFLDADEFSQVIRQLTERQIIIYRSEFDIHTALSQQGMYHADLSLLPAEPWQGEIDEFMFTEQAKNPFETWTPQEEKTAVAKRQAKEDTKQWVRRSIIFLFLYALVVGGVIIPTRPIDAEGFIVFDWVTVILIYGVYVILPIFIIYWRPKVNIYLPFIYFIVTLVGGFLSYFGGSLFNDFPPLADSVLALHLFILLIGWLPAFVIVRIGRHFLTTILKVIK